jgi:hypothetical protein
MVNPMRILAVVATALLAACASMMQSFGGGMTDELRANGVLARAEILEIWDTRWTINDDPVIGMLVRVAAVDRLPFEARIEKTTISRLAVPQFHPGNVVLVRYDPERPEVIAVDDGAADLPQAPPR